KHYGRAAGMVQTGEAIGYVAAPVLGGLLLLSVQLHGVFLIDAASFLFSILTLLLVRIPATPKTNGVGTETKPSLLGEVAYGWRYLTSRRGLLALLIYF